MYVVIRTDDLGRISTVDTAVHMGEYAACRVLDDVHARYELLDSTGVCRIDRDTDTVLCVRWDDGRVYRYEVARIAD